MRNNFLPTTLLAALLYCGPQPIRAADPPAVAGASPAIEAKLRVDRQQYHPGESVVLQGFLANAGSKELKLAGVDFARQFAFVQLHVVTPSGAEFVYDPYADNPLRSSLLAISSKSFTTKLAPSAEQSAFQKSVRLTDGLSGWSSREKPRGPLSLRAAGQYRVWFEYRVPAVADASPDAWTGAARSNTVVLTVAEPPAPQPGQQPTAQQLAAIERLQSVAPTSIEGRDLLEQAMLRAENEPLAERLVDLCLHDAHRQEDFIVMIMWRACTPDPEQGRDGPLQLGIDGPYLKTAALSVIDTYEHPPQDPNQHRMLRSMYGVNIAIAYLRFHPEDQTSRDRLIKLARESAPLPAKQSMARGGPAIQKPVQQAEWFRLHTVAAWQILLELDVLHANMALSEAIEILGPPSRQNGETATWYINTPRHVNPGLSATFKDNRVTKFQRFTG